MALLVLAVVSLAAWVGLIAFRGRFWRIDEPPAAAAPSSWPEVVVAVPARDEAAQIGRAVASLLTQDYPGRLSVVVADDHSSDGTVKVALATAAAVNGADRFCVVPVPELPQGWSGKMWAQSQAVAFALTVRPGAELVLLTDADIGHAPGELTRQVARLVEGRLDMVSLMVRLATGSLIEAAIVPAFVFFFRLLYPFRWVADPAKPTAAAAGGFILIRRAVLQSIGGLAAIKDALIDDCSLAAKVKGAGGRITLDLARDTVSLRAYDAPSLWMMIARSAYTQLRCSPWLLVGTVVAMGIGFLVPPLAVLAGGEGWLAGLAAWAAMSLAYAPMLGFYRLPVAAAPLLPLVALFYLGATIDSARRHWRGRGGEWKGRVAGGKSGNTHDL